MTIRESIVFLFYIDLQKIFPQDDSRVKGVGQNPQSSLYAKTFLKVSPYFRYFVVGFLVHSSVFLFLSFQWNSTEKHCPGKQYKITNIILTLYIIIIIIIIWSFLTSKIK